MKRGRKKKLAISLMDYMGKRRDMKRQLKKEGTAELYEVAVRHFLRFVKNPGFCLADLNRALVIDFIISVVCGRFIIWLAKSRWFLRHIIRLRI